MTENDRRQEDEGVHFDLLRSFDAHWRVVVTTALIVTAVVGLVAGVYYLWWQTSVRSVAIGFRPTFIGAQDGLYPNDLPFSSTDITAAPVLGHVFETNEIQRYCRLDQFTSSFYVEQHSPQYAILDAEYQAKLSETRLTAVERGQLQDEYEKKRATLPLEYRLVFAPGQGCTSIPPVLVRKSLTDILSSWAQQSDDRRGVLNLRVQMLSPGVLDVQVPEEGARLIRADLIRTALGHLVGNVREVEQLPGAGLISVGDDDVTLFEVRTRFEGLIRSRLEPLIVLAGRGLGAESASWVDESLASAKQKSSAAEGRVQAYLQGLREYSGMPQLAAPPPDQASQGTSDVQSLMPQIDSTFIDRIVEMSEVHTRFRQDMTRKMVEASVEAIQSRASVAYYEHLAAALRRPASRSLSPQEVDDRLSEIVKDGKLLAAQFKDLYHEWSVVALRPPAGMYQVDGPIQVVVSSPFTRNSFILLVLATFFLTLVIGGLIYVARDHFQAVRLKRQEDSSR